MTYLAFGRSGVWSSCQVRSVAKIACLRLTERELVGENSVVARSQIMRIFSLVFSLISLKEPSATPSEEEGEKNDDDKNVENAVFGSPGREKSIQSE